MSYSWQQGWIHVWGQLHVLSLYRKTRYSGNYDYVICPIFYSILSRFIWEKLHKECDLFCMEENHCQNYIMLYDVFSSNFNCMLRYAMMELLKCNFYFKIMLQFFFDIICRYITSVIVFCSLVRSLVRYVLAFLIETCSYREATTSRSKPF